MTRSTSRDSVGAGAPPAAGLDAPLTRRDMLLRTLAGTAALALPVSLGACRPGDDTTPAPPDTAPGALDEPAGEAASAEDLRRLVAWVGTLRAEGLQAPDVPFGSAAARVGELAIGTPYEAFTLEEYLRAGGSPFRAEPLRLDLSRFDCVSLVEACLALARLARRRGEPSWEAFGHEMERMRYRGGERAGYASRLHYFSEWISDGARRGLVRDLGQELGGTADRRPLRFMTSNPDSYPALAHADMVSAIADVERALDEQPRWVVPTARIAEVEPRLETGDIVAFATSIEGLDVTHAAFAYRTADGVLRVLHAPLSGGVVEITRSTLTQYVQAIRRSTGILVARPLPAVAAA
jgi:hypothetical protein